MIKLYNLVTNASNVWPVIYSRLKRIRRVPLNSPRRPRKRKRVDLVEKLRRRFVHPFIVTITMDNFKLSHLMHLIFSTWSSVEAKTDLMSLMRFDENFLVIFSMSSFLCIVPFYILAEVVQRKSTWQVKQSSTLRQTHIWKAVERSTAVQIDYPLDR